MLNTNNLRSDYKYLKTILFQNRVNTIANAHLELKSKGDCNIEMISNKVLVVDEFEALEKKETCYLLCSIFNLSFVGLLTEQVRRKLCYDFQTNNHPRENFIVDVEMLKLHYNKVVKEINFTEVWEIACDVCHCINIPLDNSWDEYLSELKDLPLMSTHLSFLAMENLPQSLPVSSRVSSVIYHGHFKIHQRLQKYPTGFRSDYM